MMVSIYERTGDIIHVLAGNVVIVFGRKGKNSIVVIRKYKLEGRTFDRGALDVAPQPFREACCLAAEILLPKKAIQGTLF